MIDFARARRQQSDHHPRDRGLAGAGFADQRKGLALADVEGDAVDGLQKFEMAAFEHAVEPRLRDVEHAAQILDVDEGRRGHAAVLLRGGVVEMAGHGLRAVPERFRPLDAAAVEREGAARIERAARRDRRQPRHRAGNLHQPLGFAGQRRDRAHQALGIGMQRVLHHVAHRADLGDPAGIHHRDAVGGLGDHAHVVGHQHHRGAVVAAEALDQRDDLRLHRDVERGGRLVGDDQFRLGADRQRDHDALAHAAGEFVRIGVDAFFRRGNADLGQQIDGALARRRCRQIEVGADGLDDLVADPVQRVEAGQRILEDHADPLAADLAHLLRRQIVDPHARQIDLAAGDAAGRIDQPDHREAGDGFAGAGFADHAQHLALGDVERHAVDRAQRAAAGDEFDPRLRTESTGSVMRRVHRAHRSFGLSASRSQSPSRLIERISAASARPGKATIHHSPANR